MAVLVLLSLTSMRTVMVMVDHGVCVFVSECMSCVCVSVADTTQTVTQWNFAHACQKSTVTVLLSCIGLATTLVLVSTSFAK